MMGGMGRAFDGGYAEYRLDQIVQAHRDMEAGTVGGKGVVLT